MKKIVFKSRSFTLMFAMIAGSLFIIVFQAKEITTQPKDTIAKANLISNKGIPSDLNFWLPRIPNSITYDSHYAVRLAYLSYLERYPENVATAYSWVMVIKMKGFSELTKGFITSPEASHRQKDHIIIF